MVSPNSYMLLWFTTTDLITIEQNEIIGTIDKLHKTVVMGIPLLKCCYISLYLETASKRGENK